MIVAVFACVLVAALLFCRREGFSVQIKGNGSVFSSLGGGVAELGRHVVGQAERLKTAAVSMVPFRAQLRQMHRRMFKKNIGLVYD